MIEDYAEVSLHTAEESLNEKVDFAHVHLHTPEGSLQDGFCRIPAMIKLAKEFGMDTIGISDHGTLFGHYKFYEACVEAGIHPVMGMEAYVSPKKGWRKANFDDVQYHNLRYLTNDDLQPVPGFDDDGNLLPAVSQYPNYAKIVKGKNDSPVETFAKSKPKTEEHVQFLKELEEKDPEAFKKLKKSTRWYLCGRLDSRQKRLFEWSPRSAHLLMIAKTQEGYSNLVHLATKGALEGFYKKPHIDYNDLKRYGKGIVATSSCLGGAIPQLIRQGKFKVAKNHIKFYQRCFDEFYLEIQPGQQEDQQRLNKILIEWSEELGVPLIATADAHMLRPEDMPVHKAITTIAKEKDDDASDINVYENCIFYSTEEMLELGMPAEALENAYKLAHSCHVKLDDTDVKYPVFGVPEGETFDTYLQKLSYEGLYEKLMSGNFRGRNFFELYSEYKKRIDYELGVIAQKKISAYVLIVWDYINWAKSQNILVGPGRGSAAGSLVCYCLGITNLDPIKYGLLFSRFINPERPGFPDCLSYAS